MVTLVRMCTSETPRKSRACFLAFLERSMRTPLTTDKIRAGMLLKVISHCERLGDTTDAGEGLRAEIRGPPSAVRGPQPVRLDDGRRFTSSLEDSGLR